MDYSLLVMLHFPSRADMLETVDSAPELASSLYGSSLSSLGDGEVPFPQSVSDGCPPFACRRADSAGGRVGSSGAVALSIATNKVDPVVEEVAAPMGQRVGGSSADTGSEFSDTLGDEIGKEWGDDDDDGADDDEDVGVAEFAGLPKLTDADFASAFHKARASSWAVRKQLGLDGGVRARTTQGSEPVLIFAGVIDILQIYGARKKLEHQYKTMRYRSEKEGISVTDPASYAHRLKTFVFSKFVVAPRPLATGALPSMPETVEGQSHAPEQPVASGNPASPSSVAVFKSSAVLLAGMAAKKGSAFPYSWGMRYWEIRPSGEMLYYSSPTDAKAGVQPRGRRQVAGISKVDNKYPNLLSINVGGTPRLMHLRLETMAERDEWCNVLSALVPGESDQAVSADL